MINLPFGTRVAIRCADGSGYIGKIGNVDGVTSSEVILYEVATIDDASLLPGQLAAYIPTPEMRFPSSVVVFDVAAIAVLT